MVRDFISTSVDTNNPDPPAAGRAARTGGTAAPRAHPPHTAGTGGYPGTAAVGASGHPGTLRDHGGRGVGTPRDAHREHPDSGKTPGQGALDTPAGGAGGYDDTHDEADHPGNRTAGRRVHTAVRTVLQPLHAAVHSAGGERPRGAVPHPVRPDPAADAVAHRLPRVRPGVRGRSRRPAGRQPADGEPSPADPHRRRAPHETTSGPVRALHGRGRGVRTVARGARDRLTARADTGRRRAGDGAPGGRPGVTVPFSHVM